MVTLQTNNEGATSFSSSLLGLEQEEGAETKSEKRTTTQNFGVELPLKSPHPNADSMPSDTDTLRSTELVSKEDIQQKHAALVCGTLFLSHDTAMVTLQTNNEGATSFSSSLLGLEQEEGAETESEIETAHNFRGELPLKSPRPNADSILSVFSSDIDTLYGTEMVSKEDIQQNHAALVCGTLFLSHDALVKILEFLYPVDLVHRTSLVCKAWLKASRSHTLWHTIHILESLNLVLSAQHMNLEGWTVEQIIQRLQNTRHCKLDLPSSRLLFIQKLPPRSAIRLLEGKVKIDKESWPKSWQKLARVCPHLEELHIWNMIPGRKSNVDFHEFADLFPELSRLHTSICYRDVFRLESFFHKMGGRLMELSLFLAKLVKKVEQDVAVGGRPFQILSQSCPNLEYLHIHRESSSVHDRWLNVMAEDSLLPVVQKCRNLKTLELVHPEHDLLLSSFQLLVQEGQSLRRLMVAGRCYYEDVNKETLRDICAVFNPALALDYIPNCSYRRRTATKLPSSKRQLYEST
eukprot:CAMPEP_0172471640 /NCGR_PEP_ID=MMETSP1065-20121228/67922_1 /TAXON_ID=265537 /ORGANISM="Amphiprora paludosa, Strain CCMP125" /LENGTH=519 /DNA_ID=CAMNT_0013229747 /DNA_START=423 /DNA_END=1982 /DNA_ORIENTATION=-